MTVLLGDTGWGCLLRGVLIGALRQETEEFAREEIDVHFFQGQRFHRKVYLKEALRVSKRILFRLLWNPSEPIVVSPGYLLSDVRSWLAAQGGELRVARIGEPLRTLLEREFLETLRSMGLDLTFEELTKRRGLTFRKCLQWLKGGDLHASHALPERERWAKTGWASYSLWAHHPYEVARSLADKRKTRGGLS